MTKQEIIEMIERAGFDAVERDTVYNRVKHLPTRGSKRASTNKRVKGRVQRIVTTFLQHQNDSKEKQIQALQEALERNAKDRQSEAPKTAAQEQVVPSEIKPATPTAPQFSKRASAEEHRPYSQEDLDQEMETGFSMLWDERTVE